MQLAFKRYGQAGPPLLILHGLFGSADNWLSMSQRLSEDFQVFALDLRNHGDSPHSDLMSYPAMAEDVYELLRAHQLGQCYVLGHSMGAKAGMQLALEHPEAVRALVCIDMAPRAYEPRHQDIIQSLVNLDLASFSSRKEMEDALASPIPDLATRRFLMKNVRRDAEGRFRWRLGVGEIAGSYSMLTQAIETGKNYTGPALFIRGADSDYLRETDLPEIRRHFKQAQMVVMPGAGHLVQVDQPGPLHELVRRFFLEQTHARAGH